MPREPHTSLAETPGLLDDLERVRPGVALRLRLEPDGHVAALQMLPPPERAPQSDRLPRGRDPDPGAYCRQGEPDGDRIERPRAESPGDEIDAAGQRQDEPSALGQH